MKHNISLINIILFSIILPNIIYSQQTSIDDNLFINRVNDAKILDIPLNIEKEVDLVSAAKKWKEAFIQSYEKKRIGRILWSVILFWKTYSLYKVFKR